MSELSTYEKIKLEKLFEMGGGYVLNFVNRTFGEFFIDNLHVDIDNEKYRISGISKANRLRAFLRLEPNYSVGKLISCLLEYWQNMKFVNSMEITADEQILFDECQKIAEKLQVGTIVEDVSVFEQFDDEKNFSLLAKSIKESIQKNDPESGLDRLHTYLIKYVRKLCDKHGISYDKDKPLHSLFGEYVKYLRQSKLIESEMSVRILKSSISILEAFNDVRNKQSFAHDNPILNHNESILIFNNVSGLIGFLQTIEQYSDNNLPNKENPDWGDLPF